MKIDFVALYMYANLYECEGQESVCVLEYLIDLYPSIKIFNKC